MPSHTAQSSRSPIDILIPAIEKDLPNLPYVIDYARRMVRHPIGSIYIVSPRVPSIMELCRRKGCVFVDENTVLPVTKKDIRYSSKRWDRSGWMFQQLLKLGGDTVCKNSRYLVLDADTVFIRPHRFRSGNKTVAYYRKWSQPEYYRNYRKLLGKKPAAPVSFVTHYMLFEKAALRKLKTAIEARHRLPWYKAILKSINRSSMFAFSEFETYGNFLYGESPGRFLFKKTRNKSIGTDIRKLSASRIKRLARSYRSLSIHKRKGYYLKKRPPRLL